MDVAVGGVELVDKAGLLGNGEIDGAVAIFDGDVREGGRAGDVDRAVAVGDEDVSRDAIEGDVAAVGGKGDGTDGVTGVEFGVTADFELSVEAPELEVGAAGVEFDGAAYVLEVRVSEELAADGDGAAEIRESGVVSASFDGKCAGDAVGGDVVVPVVNAGVDVTCDCAECDVAVVCSDGDVAFDCADLCVAAVDVDGGRNIRRHGDDEVGASTFHGGNGEGDVIAVGLKGGA